VGVHVNHPSDVILRSATDPIVRERLSAASALSTSDSRQGLSGNQSVQGEPAKTYRPQLGTLEDSLAADIHSSTSQSRHISKLAAVLSRCFLTATRKKRALSYKSCDQKVRYSRKPLFSALGFTFSLPSASAPPYRTTSRSVRSSK
jgi:hypothetical protein